MNNADGGLRFAVEDPTKLSVADLAPPSEHELLQQQQQAMQHQGSIGRSVEHGQRPPRDNGGEESSVAPKQVRRRAF